MMNKIVVIISKSHSNRLWTLSEKYSQRLKSVCASDDDSILIKTVECLCGVVSADNCFIVVSKRGFEKTCSNVKNFIPNSNVIVEPENMNIAELIAFITFLAKERFGNGILCFVSDAGCINDRYGYKEALESAYSKAEDKKDLVIIESLPVCAAVGYGYIEIDNDKDSQRILTASRFINKPDFEMAEQLIFSGEFLTDGGIIVGNINAIIQWLDSFLPDIKYIAQIVRDYNKSREIKSIDLLT